MFGQHGSLSTGDLSPPRRRDTLVTAVYDLDSDAPLGGRTRSIEYYFPSLASIVALGAGLVVYTWPSNVERISAYLQDLGATHIVIGRDLDQAPHFAQIQEIRIRKQFHTKPWRDRCHVLCHAKLAWLAEQAFLNPFGSDRVYWIDAGLAYPALFPTRYLPDYLAERCSLFTPAVLNTLAAQSAPLVMLGQHPLEGDQIHGILAEDLATFVGDDCCVIGTHVVGALFGGDLEAVEDLYVQYDRLLAAMLEQDLLGTEENVLTVLYRRNAARVNLHAFSTWYHEDSDVRRPVPGDRSFFQIFEALAFNPV